MTSNYVTLKPLSHDDFIVVTQWNYDPKVTAFFSERTKPEIEHQQVWFNNQINDTSKQKFIIICKQQKTKIGLVSLMKIDVINMNCEIGITIGNTDFWGKNHGKDAMHLMLKNCFENLKMHIVYLSVFETNIRGIKFFEKLGFNHDGMMRQNVYKNNEFISLNIMSITEIEFLNHQK